MGWLHQSLKQLIMSKSKDWGALVFWVDNSKRTIFKAILDENQIVGKEKIRLLADLKTFTMSIVR